MFALSRSGVILDSFGSEGLLNASAWGSDEDDNNDDDDDDDDDDNDDEEGNDNEEEEDGDDDNDDEDDDDDETSAKTITGEQDVSGRIKKNQILTQE